MGGGNSEIVERKSSDHEGGGDKVEGSNKRGVMTLQNAVSIVPTNFAPLLIDNLPEDEIISFLDLEDAVHLSQTCVDLRDKGARTCYFQWPNRRKEKLQDLTYLIGAINSINFSYLEKFQVEDLLGYQETEITDIVFSQMVHKLGHAKKLKYFEMNLPQVISTTNKADMSPAFNCLSNSLKCCLQLSTLKLHLSSYNIKECSAKLLSDLLSSLTVGIKHHSLTRFELLQFREIAESPIENPQDVMEKKIYFFKEVLMKNDLKVLTLKCKLDSMIDAFSAATEFSKCFDALKKVSLDLDVKLWNANASTILGFLGKCNMLEAITLHFNGFEDSSDDVMKFAWDIMFGCHLTLFHLSSLRNADMEYLRRFKETMAYRRIPAKKCDIENNHDGDRRCIIKELYCLAYDGW